MKKKTTILILLALVVLLIFASLSGIPIPTQIEENGCKASYKKYLFPRELCQYLTFGHCATTSFNKYNAEVEIAHCLCDKYEISPNIELENKILSKCNLVKPSCDSAVERIKIDFCNEEGLDSLECDAYFRNNSASKVNFICQNKDELFYRIFIR